MTSKLLSSSICRFQSETLPCSLQASYKDAQHAQHLLRERLLSAESVVALEAELADHHLDAEVIVAALRRLGEMCVTSTALSTSITSELSGEAYFKRAAGQTCLKTA